VLLNLSYAVAVTWGDMQVIEVHDPLYRQVGNLVTTYSCSAVFMRIIHMKSLAHYPDIEHG
jgi:hypothetical protein